MIKNIGEVLAIRGGVNLKRHMGVKMYEFVGEEEEIEVIVL